VTTGLDLALELIAAGVPVVVCPPRPGWNPGDKQLDVMPPGGWSVIEAADCDVSSFRGGVDTLAMVGGHGVDVVDCDPKNGGSLTNLPPFRRFGRTGTPSGGAHDYVRSTGVGKISPFETSAGHVGDYVGGTLQGGGRLLAFLPGSTRPKYPGLTYTVLEPLRLEELLENDPDDDLMNVLTACGGSRNGLPGKPSAGLSQVHTFLAEHSTDLERPCHYGRAAVAGMLNAAQATVPGDPKAGRHGWAVASATRGVELVRAGCAWSGDLDTLEATLDRIKPEGGSDWTGILAWAIANARGTVKCGLHNPAPNELHKLEQTPEAATGPFGTVPAAAPPPAGDIDFWDERDVLAHIRDFARARMTSPWAVLGVVLARVLTTAPPYVVLPPTIGTEASLNVFVALVGASGMGKGAAEGAARDALDVGEDVFTATVGSGEGVAHLYSHWTAKTGIVRDRSAVLFTIPEVDILTALGSRVGSTILSVLRSAFSGEKLGFSNASKERTLPLDRHTYRLCLILGVQPERAATLMADADGGTPQRFLWMPVGDPGIPVTTPDTPPTLKLAAQQWKRGNFPLHRLTLPDIATDTIRQAQRARLRGEGDALDGHALQVRLKVAVALTLLDGRRTVTDDDWHLSGTVMAVSDTTRAQVIARLAEQANARTEAQGRADGVRADAATQSSDERAARRISGRLLGKVVAAGELSRSDARNAIARRDRIHFDAALERLIAAGQVEVLDVESGQRIKATGVPS
jgi:hypothetical protein